MSNIDSIKEKFEEYLLLCGSSEDPERINKIKSEALLFMGFIDYFISNMGNINYDNSRLLQVLPKLIKLQNTKESYYKRSWCKHGDIGIFFTVVRKWDRIESFNDKAMSQGADSLYNDEALEESYLDTVGDLGLYGILWFAYIAEKKPELFEDFLKKNSLL
jgi:hypothetical protein